MGAVVKPRGSLRWARIFRPDARAEVEDEIGFHLEERMREYERQGMTPADARAAAEERLGDLRTVRDECARLLRAERRSEIRRDWVRVSWLDVRLGLRMLIRYPGLTLVSGLAIAFAIWIGAGTFEFVGQVLFPTLPLERGDRIVGIEKRDIASSRPNRQLLHELGIWRDELETVQELGGFRTLERNLITGSGRGEPVEVAEMSAVGFRVAGVPPLLGRTLIDADEQPGAPAVAVIGHDVWQARFGGQPDVIGRVVGLGSTRATIVGVMPDGFGFPIAQSVWVPLRLDPLDYPFGAGPALRVFGRLAPGVDLDEAQAEISAIAQRLAADHPAAYEHLRTRVRPYAKSILGLTEFLFVAGVSSINIFAVLLLVLICGNVGLLMFARAATRESELVVRSALGASRGRIVTQLFTEALVLGVLAAALGLAAAGAGLRWGMRIVEGAILDGVRLPFWFEPALSPRTILYALLLTLLVAVITGVLPGLKVTGRGVGARLRQASAGAGGFRFGGLWTWVIVTQLALTVTLPIAAFSARDNSVALTQLDVGFPADQYLAARVEMDRDLPVGAAGDTSQAAFEARYAAKLRALEHRLEAHADVRAVTFAERLPLMYHPHRRIEVDGGGAPLTGREITSFGDPALLGYRVSSSHVALDYFDVVAAPILAGRAFHSGDLATDARTVIVNQSFVRRVLGGRDLIGQVLRYRSYEEDDQQGPAANESWYEIVGVVRDMGMADTWDMKAAGIYHPTSPGGTQPMQVAVHVAGDPGAFATDLRRTAAQVEPALRLYGVMPLANVIDVELEFYAFWFRIILMVAAIALVLSLCGIYAVMSYTVARRTREIGIRVALGADARRIVLAIFRRPLIQVIAGILAGGALTGTLVVMAAGVVTPRGVAIVSAYATGMFVVCMLACVAPTRRALRVEPTEAMRAES